MRRSVKVFLWLLGSVVALFAAAAYYGPSEQYEAERRMACAKALASNIEAPIVSYADKRAYDEHVADKCSGYMPRR